MQRPRASAPLPAAGLLALLLSLALQAAAEPADPAHPEVPERPPPGILQRAARAAAHFFNFRMGSPSALRVLAAVQRGRAQLHPKKGCRVDLVFSTESFDPEEEGEEHLGRCSARVFFLKNKPRPTITISCRKLTENVKREEEDLVLYNQMKQLKNPLDIVNIPDSHGHIDPSLRPIWKLAALGSSPVLWKKTTQSLSYYMAQLRSVEQWKTNDYGIDFAYTVLLHEFSTQEIIPCHIHLVWYPGKTFKVKYQCQELQSPEASGTEEG